MRPTAHETLTKVAGAMLGGVFSALEPRSIPMAGFSIAHAKSWLERDREERAQAREKASGPVMASEASEPAPRPSDPAPSPDRFVALTEAELQRLLKGADMSGLVQRGGSRSDPSKAGFIVDGTATFRQQRLDGSAGARACSHFPSRRLTSAT
ncbi:MAG: hypothetical protein ACOZQL_08270 [Myxococcota bacterium]